MSKNEAKRKLIQILLEQKEPITIERLAKLVNVSSRSIRTYLSEIETANMLGQLKLIKKPNVGVYLEGTELDRKRLKSQLSPSQEVLNTFAPEARKLYILKTLFKNRYTYTIQLLADDLYVSKGTIVNDLVDVQKWLEKHGLKLRRKPNQGLWIEGDEYLLRRALMDLSTEVKKVESGPDDAKELDELDYRIDFINYNRIKQLFPKLDILRLQAILQEAEHMLGYHFTDEAFINLIIHIAITMERIKHNKALEIPQEQEDKLKLNYEYQVAQWVVAKIEQVFGMSIPSAETGYISLHMLGARVQQNLNGDDAEGVLESENREYVDLAKAIIRVVGDILNIDLSQDKLLLTGLALHLRPTVMRIRFGMKLRNPLLERIKQEYTSIYGAAWAASNIFEKAFGVTVNEAEVGHIAMHIGAAVERTKQRLRTIVVCASGVGTSQLVAGRLRREIPDLDVIEILPMMDLAQHLLSQVDLVISTVPIKSSSNKVVQISTLVDEQDLQKVRSFVKQRSEQKITSTRQQLQSIFSPALCFVDVQVASKEELISRFGYLLEKQGFVSTGFVESALQREELTSTSVGKGIAIPHGRDEFVQQPAICVVKLKQPLKWGEENVDLVFLLALKFDNGLATKAFFRTFYNLLDDETFLARIRATNEVGEILEIILREDAENETTN